MEGLVEYTFWPDNHVELNLTFPILLQTGDELKIMEANKKMVWHGIIEFVPLRYWLGDKSKRNDLLHGSCKQKNVAYSD